MFVLQVIKGGVSRLKTCFNVGRYKEAGFKTEMSEEFSEENVNAGKIEIPKMKIGIGNGPQPCAKIRTLGITRDK